MIVLAGADLVLPGGIQPEGSLVLDGDRIVDIQPGTTGASGATGLSRRSGEAAEADAGAIDLRGHIVLPGFVDVHVHGLDGIDTLDGGAAIRSLSERVARRGVTAFCPTTVACAPEPLRQVLQAVAALRTATTNGARVLPAHLESNFINPDFRGAQPEACLRLPPSPGRAPHDDRDFSGRDILAEIDGGGDNVAIVTLAPELDGALDLVRHLVSRGRRVSLGHSSATLEQSRAAIAAGARQATHLFNRMPPLSAREPGLVGAILTSDEVAAEIICDGVHVHRDMVRMAIGTKGLARVMAITDGVAAAGLPYGSTASLGGRTVRVKSAAAYLDDGTLAGSVTTMDRVFRFLVNDVGLSLNDAARLCATTPATELGLTDTGTIIKGAIADLVVVDRDLNVRQTYVGGRLVYSAL